MVYLSLSYHVCGYHIYAPNLLKRVPYWVSTKDRITSMKIYNQKKKIMKMVDLLLSCTMRCIRWYKILDV